MKSKFKKLMAAALVLCLMLALLPAGVLADGPHDITVTAPDNGSIQVAQNASSGDLVTFNVTPTDGSYGVLSAKVISTENSTNVEIESMTTGKGGVVSCTFTMPDYPVTISAVINPYKQVNISGGVSATDPSTSAIVGSTVTVTPNAAEEGYELSEVWWMAAEGTTGDTTKYPIKLNGDKYQFTMPEYNVTVGATFTEIVTPPEPVKHSITTAQSSYGTIGADKQQAAEGETVNVTVTTITDYVVSKVYYTDYYNTVNVPLTGSNGSYTFVMPAYNVEIHAEYTYVPPMPTTYTVTTNIPTGGSVTATPSTGLNYGETVTVTVQPYDGYYLKSLTVGGADVTNLVTWDWYWNWYYGRTGTYSFAVTGNTSVVAEFDTWYDGDIACIYDGRFGNVSLNVWSKALDRFVPYTTASKGDLVQVIVEPYNGYAMNSLSISERNYWGSSVDYWQSWKHDNVYYFYMPDSDVNLYVDFTEAVSEHIVYVDRAANGSLKADTTWAADGQIVYVTATPDTGYVLSSLFVKTAKGDQLKVYEAKKAGVYYFYMPDQYVTVSAYFAPAASALPFNDVAYTSWYYDAVKFVYDKGIMDGVSYYKFAPDATITRGMVVTMLWRMAGEPYEAAAGFTDVAAGRYYTTAVAWAARNGIVEGMTATTFAPDQAITREQLASILYRYAKWLGFSGYGSDISGYTDAGKVSSYAYDAMSWAVRSGVVTGTSARVLDPQGTASRAAAAQMFMNFYNYIK